MAMVPLTSGCNNSNSQPLSLDKSHLRDASFSSYLNRSEESLVRNLAESSMNPNSINTTPHEHLYFGRKKVEDGEIGVFGAEKYFNGGINYRNTKDEPVGLGPAKAKTQPGTPSIHSESSWNSQRALLQSVLRNPPQKKTRKRHGKGLLASLGCHCYCHDKNSVDIDDPVGEITSKRIVSCGVVQGKTVTQEPIQNGPGTLDLARINKSRLNPWVMEEMQCKKINEVGLGSNRDDCFTFPILNSNEENLAAVEVHLQEQEDDKQRKSLEVFGSPALEKKSKSLTMLAWDTNARPEELKIPATSEGIYNDTESDASSDLFEIEDFTNSGDPFLLRQASDGMSSCVSVTPTTCYAPSEASIEWSVATASAADFSVMSDSDQDLTSPATIANAQKMTAKAKAEAGKGIERRRSGILLGCKSQKAVRVAGDAYRTNGKAVPGPSRSHKPDSSAVPVTRFQVETETRLTGFDSRCSLSRPYSAQASHLLYIQ